MHSGGELAWFRGELWRSIARPRDFARALAREHYGLAGVLVALLSGVCLSVGIDLLVLASKGLSATDYLSRLFTDALLLGVRLLVTAAAVAWAANGAVRALGGRAGSLDQLFTALTFATAPLALIPLPAAIVALATTDATLTVAAAIVVIVVVRVAVGLALNIRAILPPAIAAASFALVVVLGSFVLGDQVSRMRFLVYALAPQIVPELAATPAAGERAEQIGFTLTLPKGWTNSTRGIPGEAARFESDEATLVVARARSAALNTADSYADAVAAPQKVGLRDAWHRRSVTRIDGVVVVDDAYGGLYEGRTILWRQFTAVPGSQGLALVYRVVEPKDPSASLAEAASIAATWQITSAGR